MAVKSRPTEGQWEKPFTGVMYTGVMMVRFLPEAPYPRHRRKPRSIRSFQVSASDLLLAKCQSYSMRAAAAAPSSSTKQVAHSSMCVMEKCTEFSEES